MLKVKFCKTDKHNELDISGHAEFADFGEDIICAAVSAIVFGGINALEASNSGNDWFTIEDNRIRIMIAKNNHDSQVIMETIYIQLETIAESFPENISIIQEVEKC